MKTIIIAFISLFFSSCMHLAMTGMSGHGEDDGTDHQTTLEKELTVGNVRVNALFPVMEKGKETVFTLKLSKASTHEGITGAEVYGHFDYFHHAASAHSHSGMMMEEQPDTSGQMDQSYAKPDAVDSSVQRVDHSGAAVERIPSDHQISMHLEATEGKEPGTYTFIVTPPSEGEYIGAFHIVSIDGEKLTPEILIEAKRNVSDAPMHAQGSMMGMGGSSTYLIVGGVLMGTMMVVAWLVRGGVHW